MKNTNKKRTTLKELVCETMSFSAMLGILLLIAVYGIIVSMTTETATETASIYAKTAKVVYLDYNTDLVTVQDNKGFLWCFYGIGSYQINDYVKLTMSNNNTDIIFDDIIISIQYTEIDY